MVLRVELVDVGGAEGAPSTEGEVVWTKRSTRRSLRIAGVVAVPGPGGP